MSHELACPRLASSGMHSCGAAGGERPPAFSGGQPRVPRVDCMGCDLSSAESRVLRHLPDFRGCVSGLLVLFHGLFLIPASTPQHMECLTVGITSFSPCWGIPAPPPHTHANSFKELINHLHFSINFRLSISRPVLLGWSLDELNACYFGARSQSLPAYGGHSLTSFIKVL